MLKLPGAAVVAVLVTGTGAAWAQAADGQLLYEKHCRMCHGATGAPPQAMMKNFKNLKSLADSAYMSARSEDSVVAVLAKGIGQMKPFAEKLKHEEMVAIAKYTLTLPQKAANR